MFLFDALEPFCWDDIIPKKVLQPNKHLQLLFSTWISEDQVLCFARCHLFSFMVG